MTVVADRVIVELEARLSKYDADVKKAESTFTGSMGRTERKANTTAVKTEAAARKRAAAEASAAASTARAEAAERTARAASEKAAARKAAAIEAANARAAASEREAAASAAASAARREAAEASASARTTAAKVEAAAKAEAAERASAAKIEAARAAGRARAEAADRAAAARAAADQARSAAEAERIAQRTADRRARAAERAAAREAAAAQRAAAAQAAAQAATARQIEAQINRSSGAATSQFRQLAGALAAGVSARGITVLTDEYTRFTNTLRVAGLEGDQFAQVQERLRTIGNQYGVEINALAGVFGRATLAQKDLGASTEDIIRLNEIIAAGLKITGTSTAEASGALLQLGQALGAGVVRAEEFNSILEGALPIAQAAARGIDGFDGSVSKLRIAIAEGEITSRQFFEGVLRGGTDTIKQAESATLTLAGAFTVLKNELILYIGQADQSLGASDKLRAALEALANNLDTVATALGVIGALLVGRFAAGMVAAAGSTGVASAAIFALQARAAGAATGMEALAFTSRAAGASMLAAFGGPVGLAVTGLVLGIGYLVTSNAEAAAAASDLEASINAQAASLQNAEQRAAAAAAAADNLTSQQRGALTSTAALTGEVDKLSEAWGRVAAQAKAAAVEQARAAAQQASRNVVAAGDAYVEARDRAFNRAATRPFAERGLSRDAPATNGPQALAAAEAATTAERSLLQRAVANRRNAQAELARIEGQGLADFRATPAAATAGKPKKTPSSRARRSAEIDPAEVARRFEDDLSRSRLEYDRAQTELTNTVIARAQLERATIESERASNARSIAAEENYTAAQKQALLELNDQIAQARIDVVNRAEIADIAAEEAALAAASLQDQQAAAQAAARLVDTREERLEAELRILDLQFREERLRLETIANNEQLNATEREIARRRLAQLDAMKGAAEADVRRQNESPGQRAVRDLNAESLNDQLERVQVEGLRKLEDGLVGIVTGTKNVAEAFSDMARSIIADLIRIAVQRAIIEPLANSLFGGGGGGGIGTIFAPGRASGGHVSAGQSYRVQEFARGEVFTPSQSGKVQNLGQMKGGAGGGNVYEGDVNMPITVSAPGANAQTVELIRKTLADAAPSLVQAAQRATTRTLTRKRMN